MEQEEQRREWRKRQRNSRAARAEREQEEELAELRERDPIAARFQEMWAEAMAQPITKPGVPVPQTHPEVIKARNEKFDREKQECERKTTQQGRRTLFALTHGMPVGWAALYLDQFPSELR